MGLNQKTNPQVFINHYSSRVKCSACVAGRCMLWLMSASEVCIGPPGFIRLHRFSVVGVRWVTLKRRPDLCLHLGCLLSRVWQAIVRSGFPPSNPLCFSFRGNKVTRHCCCSLLASLLGAVSWVCLQGACQVQAGVYIQCGNLPSKKDSLALVFCSFLMKTIHAPWIIIWAELFFPPYTAPKQVLWVM